MTNFEHVLKIIDPEVLKDILSEKLAVMKGTGEIYKCSPALNNCNNIHERCIFRDDCLNFNGPASTRKWLDQEYIGPETTNVAITSGEISW